MTAPSVPSRGEPRISLQYPEDIDPQVHHLHQFPFLDEFVADNATVHFEAMSNAQFWIGIDLPDGRHYAINCGAVNNQAKGYATVEEA